MKLELSGGPGLPLVKRGPPVSLLATWGRCSALQWPPQPQGLSGTEFELPVLGGCQSQQDGSVTGTCTAT